MIEKTSQTLPSYAESEKTKESLLFKALTHPKFVEGIREVAQHTLEEGVEAGLAVYSTGFGV
jgi:hypothetical protein